MLKTFPKVEIVVDNDTYTLQLGINGCCDVEDLTDRRFVDTLVDCDRGMISAMRLVLWGATRRHHPDLKLHEVGAWIDKIGFDALLQQLRELTSDETPVRPSQARRGKKPKAA